MKNTILIALIICSFFTSTMAMPKGISANEVTRNHVNTISKMIKALQPELNKTDRNRIAYSLYMTTKKYKIDPKLMIAIIGTESDFRNEKVSTTGDLSMAQINASVWNKEFTRIGRDSLNSKRLKKDEGYALSKMAEILIILKERHSKKDDKWFARYHSQTKKFKNLYSAKVEKRLRIIASIN
ncbi:MAG: transglycosylase SLT domain-containing protein [Bacteriovorax sp.]|nr:transglycosylase SLT domain-containing protein [Bacteriovorax sp.]